MTTLDTNIPADIINKVILYKDYTVILSLNNILKSNNKFFIMQILEYKNDNKDMNNVYFLYYRYGRIGNIGKIDIDCYIDVKKAIEMFEFIFLEKSGIEWPDRHNENKYIVGKYIYTDLKDDKEDLGEEDDIEEIKPEIVLDKNIESFIKFIYSRAGDYDSYSKELQFNATNKPLGSISKKQINKASLVLDNINTIINNNDKIDAKLNTELIHLSSEFYSIIPTYMRSKEINIINTKEMLDNKYNLLTLLLNSNTLLKNTMKSKDLYNQYINLMADIKYIDKHSEEFNLINTYFTLNKGPTHNCKLKISGLYKINRYFESNYKTTDDSYLLWHGTYAINAVGIITNGLKIFNKAAHGSMFGRGLYFANISTKSAGYIGLNYAKKGEKYIMFLCEIQLNNIIYDYKDKISDDNVIHGKGMYYPNPAQHKKIDGITVPIGDILNTTLLLRLYYDEFVVFNTNKIRLRYIVELTTD